MTRCSDWQLAAIVVVLSVAALIFGPYLIAPPPLVLDEAFAALSPRLFPTLIVAGTGIVAAIFVLSEARARPVAGADGDAGLAPPVGWRQAAFLVLVAACAMLLDRTGFLATAFGLTAGTAMLAGNRKPLQIIAVSIAGPLLFYVLVTHVLQTPLPANDRIEGMLMPFVQRLPGL